MALSILREVEGLSPQTISDYDFRLVPGPYGPTARGHHCPTCGGTAFRKSDNGFLVQTDHVFGQDVSDELIENTTSFVLFDDEQGIVGRYGSAVDAERAKAGARYVFSTEIDVPDRAVAKKGKAAAQVATVF